MDLQCCCAFLFSFHQCWLEENLDCKVNHLNSTDDREPREETHGASNETDLILDFDLDIPLDLVEGGRVEEDLNQLQGWVIQFFPWKLTDEGHWTLNKTQTKVFLICRCIESEGPWVVFLVFPVLLNQSVESLLAFFCSSVLTPSHFFIYPLHINVEPFARRLATISLLYSVVYATSSSWVANGAFLKDICSWK